MSHVYTTGQNLPKEDQDGSPETNKFDFTDSAQTVNFANPIKRLTFRADEDFYIRFGDDATADENSMYFVKGVWHVLELDNVESMSIIRSTANGSLTYTTVLVRPTV